MFKLNKKTEYALISLRHMQTNKNITISTKEISNEYMIPKDILAKTLQQMSHFGYIIAFQGSKGGYKINKSLKNISLTEFVERMEGPLGIADCNISEDCIQLPNCNIRIPINKINDNLRSIFNKITLYDLTK